jgi:hypothetical protein
LVSKIVDKWLIQKKTEYVVLAGFDESLIKSSIGYLEQIHVFVIAEVDANSPLLEELGRLFSPFSSILFTESSSYHLPVFKDDGSLWEFDNKFDELVYFTASKFSDSGSGAKTPLTIISLSHIPSQTDGTVDFSPSGSGSGEGEKNNKKRVDKGKKRDTGDKKDEADKNNEDPSHNPEDPPRDQGGITAWPIKISFEVTSQIYPTQEEQNVSDSEMHQIQDKQNISEILPIKGKQNTSQP